MTRQFCKVFLVDDCTTNFSYLVVLRESGCIINIQPIEYFPFNGLVNITWMSCMNHCTCKVINKLYIAAMECYI